MLGKWNPSPEALACCLCAVKSIYPSCNDGSAPSRCDSLCQPPPPASRTHSTLTPFFCLLQDISFFFNRVWRPLRGERSTNQPRRSFVFIKHEGAQTKTYSGCKWSKCQLGRGGEIIIRFITQINSSSQAFKSSLVFR